MRGLRLPRAGLRGALGQDVRRATWLRTEMCSPVVAVVAPGLLFPKPWRLPVMVPP